MSGSIKEKMKDPYHEFIRIIDKAKDEIIEKLEQEKYSKQISSKIAKEFLAKL